MIYKSTYLFGFVIGNFYTEHHKHPSKMIDLSVHCRESQKLRLKLVSFEMVDAVIKGM